MSDSPYNFLPPDDAIATARKTGDYLDNWLFRRAPAFVATNMGPDPRLSEVTGLPPAANYLPFTGAVEGAGAFAGWGYNVLRNIANYGLENAGYQTRLPPQWKWTKVAGEQFGKTHDEITQQLGGRKTDPTDIADVMGDAAVSGAAGMIPIASGGLAKAVGTVVEKAFGRIPGAVASNATNFVVPTTHNAAQNMLIGTGLGGVLGAREGAKIQQEIKDQGLTPQQVRDYLEQQQQQQQQTEQAPQGPVPEPQSTVTPSTQYAAKQGDTIFDATPATMQPTDQSTRVDTSPVYDATQGSTIYDATSGQAAPTFEPGGGKSGTSLFDVVFDVGLLVAGVSAAKFFHGLGAEVTQAARDMRAMRPDYVAASQDYNNKNIAVRGSPISPSAGDKGMPPAPLPPTNALRQITSAVKDATLDHTARMGDFIDSISRTPQEAELLRRQFQNVHNDALHQVLATEFMNTGHDPHVNFQMQQQPRRLYEAIVAEPDDVQKILMDGLFARNEIQNRTRNMRTYGNPLPYDFKQLSIRELQNYVNTMMADPKLAEYARRYDMINHDFPDLGVAYGYMPVADARKLQTERSHVVYETDHNGRIIQTFGERIGKPYTGNDIVFTPPWVSQMQHIEALYRDYRVNQVNRWILQAAQQFEHDYPHSAKLFTPENIPALPQYGVRPGEALNPKAIPILVIRNGASGAQAWHVRNPMIYEMMSGENTTRQRAAMGSYSAMRRIYTQGVTGVYGALSGRIFPLLPGVRTTIDLGINAPKGSRAGLLQSTTKWRGLDPTSLVGGLAYSYPRRRIEAAAATMGRLLNPISPSPINKYLRATIGDVATDGISAAMDRFYKDWSVLHEQRSYGVGGQASMLKSDLPGYKGYGGTPYRSVFNETVPELLMNNGPLPGLRPRFIHVRGAAERQYQALNDFGHDFWYDINRNSAKYAGRKDVLAYEARSLTGDFGAGGSSRALQTVNAVVPWANITAQGLRRRGRALAERPVGTTLSYINTMGSLALLSLWTMMGRDDAIDYMENVLSTSQRAANVYLFQRGKPPDQHIALSLSQEDSVGYSFMLDILSKAMNLTHLRGVPEGTAEWGKFLDDYFHEHIMNSNLESSEHGLQRAIGLDIPLLNAFTGFFFDKSVSPDVSRLWDAYRNGTFGVESFNRGAGTWHGSPNHPSGDTVLDSVTGKKLSDLVSNIFGLAGAAFDFVHGVSRYYAQTDDFIGSLGKAGADWLQQARDYNPSMNTLLWENAAKSSMVPPVVEYNRQRMEAMKLTEGMKQGELMQGTTGGNRAYALPLPPTTADPKAPTDPQMREIYYSTGQRYAWLQSHIVAQAEALRRQIDSIEAQGIDPTERRRITNILRREYADKWRTVGSFIDDLNGALSQKYGRVIDVGKKIDWNGKIDQFEPIRQ